MDAHFDIHRYAADIKKLPEPTHRTSWKRVFDDMAVHTRGTLPQKLIDQHFPNESEESRCFRLANYRPITKSAINRAVNLAKLFSDANYSYRISDALQQYLGKKTFAVQGKQFDVWTYIQGVVLRRMVEDPNGYWLGCLRRGGQSRSAR